MGLGGGGLRVLFVGLDQGVIDGNLGFGSARICEGRAYGVLWFLPSVGVGI